MFISNFQLAFALTLTCRPSGDIQRDSWIDAARLQPGDMVALAGGGVLRGTILRRGLDSLLRR